MKLSSFIVLFSVMFILSSCEKDEIEDAKKDVSKGLVAYYTFDNGDASDLSNSKFNGVLLNSPGFVEPGPNGSGRALFLNGLKEQFMNIPYNPFKTTTDFSASMWIKDSGPGVLFSAISTDYTRSDFPKLIANSNEMFVLQTSYDSWGNSTQFNYSYKGLQDGSWHLITVVVDSDADEYSSACTKKLFVDGRLVDAVEGVKPYDSSCTKIQIGGDCDGKMSTFSSSMKVDNIRFYNRALSDIEVEAIYIIEK